MSYLIACSNCQQLFLPKASKHLCSDCAPVMKAHCTCPLCCITLRMDIEQVFVRSPKWMGIFQVRSMVNWDWCSWRFFKRVWKTMITDGLLIESFAPDSDEFPRYLLSRLITRPGK